MCPYLFKLRGKFAHDAACDVRHDNGMSMPWYWERTSGEFGQGFHSEEASGSFQQLGTTLLQASLPVSVQRCVRIEDGKIWARYAVRRAAARAKPSRPAGIAI